MTNGEKFKEVFGFGADGSRVIAVNSTWWDCEFQNRNVDDELVKRLRDAATMSEALAVLLPHSEGNATAKLYNEAADAIEKLTAYVRQIEELRKDGYYLQKTKMTSYGQAIITEPLPQPPKKVGKLHVGKNGVASITEIQEEEG